MELLRGWLIPVALATRPSSAEPHGAELLENWILRVLVYVGRFRRPPCSLNVNRMLHGIIIYHVKRWYTPVVCMHPLPFTFISALMKHQAAKGQSCLWNRSLWPFLWLFQSWRLQMEEIKQWKETTREHLAPGFSFMTALSSFHFHCRLMHSRDSSAWKESPREALLTSCSLVVQVCPFHSLIFSADTVQKCRLVNKINQHKIKHFNCGVCARIKKLERFCFCFF